ncbi:cysteine hydrolase family protein [Propionicicella superfundia]|uniref:cysteine hydrolase family protein n=1 Tax=Propionicicella superfundia TaxID=348582 RepID=UPI00055FC6F6|nr:cysteine hydrolase family protein [Propionicicella superfundia]
MDLTSPEWDRSALLVIDVQRDFIDDDGSAHVPGTADIVPRLGRLVTAFRVAGRPIVHVIRLYRGEDVDLPRRQLVASGVSLVAPGSPGASVPGVLFPEGDVDLDTTALLRGEFQQIGPTEYIAFKPRWSAFYRTGLHDWLRQQDVTTVVVAGCNLPNCPRATLFDASARDYRTVLVPDVTSQVTPERLADARLIGTQIVESGEIVARFSPAEGS